MRILFLALVALCLSAPVFSQKNKTTPPVAVAKTAYEETLYNALEWRCVGPFRGGRSAAVTGVPGKPNLFYFGSTGGGVWRTTDGGRTWENISDGFFGGSVGAVEVAPSDPNVIFVGGGEKTVRGNVSYGSGLWKSTDAGQTWTVVYENLLGPQTLTNTTMITASIGLVVGDNGRILRTTDGGVNWTVVPSGTTDVIRAVRCLTTTLCLASGGINLLRSTDAGASWALLSPAGFAGANNIARVSDTIAIAGSGGGWQRTIDGGQTWTQAYSAVLGSQLGASFNAAGVGIAVGYDGILRSTDFGATWVRQNLPISFDLYSAAWLNATTVLVGGDGGAILRNLQAGAP